MVSPARLCLVCKGSRLLCGWRFCPLYSRQRAVPEIRKRLGKEYFGPSTSVFVGHNFYPNVYVGPLAPLQTEDISLIDSPQRWFGMPYGDIIRFRSFMLRSKQQEGVRSGSRFIDHMQQLSMASRPTDVELGFKKVPKVDFEFSPIVRPMGPTASLSSFRVTENPRIPAKVDRIVSDDLPAADAAGMLFSRGVDLHRIVTILSSGALGMPGNKRLVPTRWSITAMDSTLGNRMLERVKTFKSVNDYMVFESEYLDNHFVIMLMPGDWEFENFEAWAPGSTWSSNLKHTEILAEYEPYKGRTRYASLQAGGFYASRFSIISALHRMRRQARVIAFREVSQGYTVPLGVWVVRSTAGHAFENGPARFSAREDALKYIGTRLRIRLADYIRESRMLSQRRVRDFLKKG